MTKPLIIIQGPIATRSGYGNHTRDLATSLIRANKYDVKIISLPWGVTPMNALEADNKDHLEILKRVAKQGQQLNTPDIFIQVSVPNEFCMSADGKQVIRPGKFNIGVTAGIETTLVSHEFIEGCNRMDMVITTSEHSKNGFITCKYDKMDKETKEKIGELKIEKPIEVLFEGADLNIYKKTPKIHETVLEELKDIKDDFCYLFVGHWLQGDLGQDRKDVGMMIKTFCESFRRKSARNRPGLIIKTSHATFSIIDRTEITKKIQSIVLPYGDNIPNIYLLHGDLTDAEMNSLYNHSKVKAMVSFTKGEGFGRPLLEFSLTGKPIIASNWSGHIDFLHKDYCTLLPGELTGVHASAQDRFVLKDSKWFTVNYAYASRVLQDVMKNYKNYLQKSRKQGHYSKMNFSLDHMAEKFCTIIDKAIDTIPKPVKLQLPKLKKVDSSTPKVKLPKLKKVDS